MIISEIRYDQAIERLRFDAEHYQPDFLKNEKILKRVKCVHLRDVAVFSKMRRNPENDPDREFEYIDISNVNTFTGEITTQRLKGYQAPSRARKVVRENDIILSTVRPNRNAVAIIPGELDNEICSTGFSVIKAKKINPWFLFAFLKTKYAINQLVRLTMASMYPAVSEEDIGTILLPPSFFQENIESIIKESYEKLRVANEKYMEAETLLSKILGIEKLELRQDKTFEISFNKVESEQRFDAEYYMPKYTEISKLLEVSGFEIKKLKELSKEVIRKINPLDRPSEKFTYIEIGDVDVSSGTIETKFILGHEAPPNAQRLLKKGDLVISTVRPTRGAITIIPEELDNSVGSTAFYVVSPESPLREFLFLYMRSLLGLNQLGRPVVGAMYPTLKKHYIDNIEIALVPNKIQQKISSLINEFLTFHKEAKELLNKAKKEVENFIEKRS
jgi:restriction endonuclease S subunit